MMQVFLSTAPTIPVFQIHSVRLKEESVNICRTMRRPGHFISFVNGKLKELSFLTSTELKKLKMVCS